MPDRGSLCGHPGSVDTWSEGSSFRWMSGTFSSAAISTDITVEMALLLLVDGESPHTSLDIFWHCPNREEEECLIIAGLGWNYRLSHGLQEYCVREGAHYWSAGVNIPSSCLAFSDIPLVAVLGHFAIVCVSASPSSSLHSVFASMSGVGPQPFLWCLAFIVFCLDGLPFFLLLG